MKHGQDDGDALADLVVIEVAAIISRRRGGRCEISRRGHTDTSQHGPHGELQLHLAAGGLAQVNGAAREVDVPGHDVVAALPYHVRLVVVRVDSLDIVRGQGEEAQTVSRISPVAVQPDLAQLDRERVARFRPFDVEGTGERVAAWRHLFVALILPAGVQRPGDYHVAGLDPLEDGVGVGESTVVVIGNARAVLREQGRREKKDDRVAWTHFSSLHERRWE